MQIKAKLISNQSVCASCKDRACMSESKQLVCSKATDVTILGFINTSSARSRDYFEAIIALENGAITTMPIGRLIYTEEDN
jgi:hypothetical protein